MNAGKIRSPILLITLVLLSLGCSSNSDSQAKNGTQGESTYKDVGLPVLELPAQKLASTQYESPSSNDNDSVFFELPASESGLDLQNVWNPSEEHRNLVNPIFGAGVAIGDYDNDGLQDVFVARSTDAGRLFRNLGAMKFEDVTLKVGINPEGMWASGTSFVDINNDGRLDIYLCGFDCPNRLYINQGDQFVERARDYGLDFSGSSIEMAFSDYDCDGDLDAYLVTNHLKPKQDNVRLKITRRPGKAPLVNEEFRELFYFFEHDGQYRRLRGGQYDYLFRNDNGKFVDVTEEAGIGKNPYLGLSANWWDFNDDGLPDLYVANDFMGPDILYQNNGPNEAGVVTFTDVTRKSLPHTPWFSMGSDFGDINNDGKMDYLASDMAGTNHYRDKLSMGNMSGPDSNAWFLNAPDPPQYMRNALYLNTGTKRFMEIGFLSSLAKTDWTWTVKFADFDNDGWQDVFFTNGMTRDLQNGDLLAELKTIQQKHAVSGDKSKSSYEVAQEFWENQEPFRLENMAFKNTGNLKFKNVGKAWGLDHLGVSTGAAVGDLDNDGDLDLIVNGFEEPVRLYRNDCANKNSIRIRLIGSKSNRLAIGATAKLKMSDGSEQIRYLSNSRGFMSTSEPILHFGLGNQKQVDSITIAWPDGTTQSLANLEANQLYTIVEQATEKLKPQKVLDRMFVESDSLNEFKHAEQEFDDFIYQPLLPNKYSQLGPGISVADIDNDGDDDIYLGGAAYSSGRILINTDGKFSAMSQPAFEVDRICEDMGSLFFDADLDGDQDLYVVSGGVEFEFGNKYYQDRLYLNDGIGKFTRSDWLPENFHSGSCVCASDYDRDGDVDLFVGGRIKPRSWPLEPKSMLLENVGNKFKVNTTDVIPEAESSGMVTSAVWSDVNNDQWSDLLVTYEFGPIRYYENQQGKLSDRTEEAGLAGDIGWFNSICSGDIDNDGDIDFVAGNFGLNTKYKVDKEHTAFLYYGDFEGNGVNRIVEAKFEGENCLPRRGLSCSSHAMPMVKKSHPTFHEFAIADLVDIYSDQKIEQARKYEANNLYSMVIVNNSEAGEARFEFKNLPLIAQASPVFGCCLSDVDGDGNLDLMLAQNFYGPQRETGYMDGGIGQLLMGNGDGTFTPVSADKSGVVIPGDATSLVTTDLNADSKVDFLVGINNSAPQVFINQTKSTLKAIDLSTLAKSSADKPGEWFPGQKFLIKLENGKKRLHEITFGSGYLSQSSTTFFAPSLDGVESVANTVSQNSPINSQD